MRRSLGLNGKDRSGFILALAVATVLALMAEADLEARFDASGLVALEVDGSNLLESGEPRVEDILLETGRPDGDRFQWTFARSPDAAVATEYEVASRTHRQRFSWGVLSVQYAADHDRLDLTVILENQSPQPIAYFDVTLMRLVFPDGTTFEPKGRGGLVSSLDNVAEVTAQWGQHKVMGVCFAADPPVRFGLSSSSDPQGKRRALKLCGGVPAAEPGAYHLEPHGRPRLPAGSNLTVRISLCRVPPSAEAPRDLADAYEGFRQCHPLRVQWPDRRPIGMLMLPSGAPKTVQNPRGWFKDARPPVEVITPEGRADFRRRMLAYAQSAVRVLTNLNGQGGIVWNLEGEENPHPITYIGDPRMTARLAPEMDEVADAFFEVFRQAKLRTGVCIRPSQVYYDETKKQWSHGTGSDGGPGRGDHYPEIRAKSGLPWWEFFPVAERLIDKIAYAKKRWGCTLFYIDTNGIHRPWGEDRKFIWTLLEAGVLRRVLEVHPDVLLIPELVRDDHAYHAAYWAYAAPYGELDMGQWETPARIRAMLPGAFSVLNVSDGDFQKHREEIVRAVRNGDILMVHGWWSPRRNYECREVYEEVYPGFLTKGDQATLR